MENPYKNSQTSLQKWDEDITMNGTAGTTPLFYEINLKINCSFLLAPLFDQTELFKTVTPHSTFHSGRRNQDGDT